MKNKNNDHDNNGLKITIIMNKDRINDYNNHHHNNTDCNNHNNN